MKRKQKRINIYDIINTFPFLSIDNQLICICGSFNNTYLYSHFFFIMFIDLFKNNSFRIVKLIEHNLYKQRI